MSEIWLLSQGPHEVSPGRPLAKACNRTSVILLELSRFSVASSGQPLAKACTPMPEAAATEGSSEIRPEQPLAKAYTPTSVILAPSQGFSVVSVGQPLAQACTLMSEIANESSPGPARKSLHSKARDLLAESKIE